MAVPKRKTSRSSTRSRKSANMRLVPERALAVPQLRRVEAPAHGVQQLWLAIEVGRYSTSTDRA